MPSAAPTYTSMTRYDTNTTHVFCGGGDYVRAWQGKRTRKCTHSETIRCRIAQERATNKVER